jgi:hypothetical protein
LGRNCRHMDFHVVPPGRMEPVPFLFPHSGP